MTGYSDKNLIDKLGIKPGMRVVIMRPPAGYLELMPDLEQRAKVLTRPSGRMDFIQYFATSPEQLGAVMGNLASHLTPAGMVWACWAKRSGTLHTGLDEREVRRIGLEAGLVDVKVAAIDDDWSALKFVQRRVDR